MIYQPQGLSGLTLYKETSPGTFEPTELAQGIRGGIRVANAEIGVAQNRVDSGLTNVRRTMTFPDGQGPTAIRARYVSGTAPVKCYLVVNAISDQHADNELATPPSQDATTERFTVPDSAAAANGISVSSETPISRIDYILSAADAGSELEVEGV